MGAAKSQTRQSTHARTHEDSTSKRPLEDHQKDKSKQGGQEVADREVVQYGKPQPAGSLSTEAGSQCPGLQGKSPSCLCSTRDSLPSVAREAMHQNSSLRGCDTLCLLSRGMGGSLEALPPVLHPPCAAQVRPAPAALQGRCPPSPVVLGFPGPTQGEG